MNSREDLTRLTEASAIGPNPISPSVSEPSDTNSTSTPKRRYTTTAHNLERTPNAIENVEEWRIIACLADGGYGLIGGILFISSSSNLTIS